MKTKKTLSVILSVLMLLSLFAPLSFAANDAKDEKLTTTVGVLSFSVNEFGNALVDACDPAATGTVVVPSTVKIDELEYNVREVGAHAFSGCDKVTRITISEGITQIGNKAFENCTSLEILDIPKTLMSCQYDAFDGCNMVTVNGYSENYQFFAVNFFSKNITFNRIDSNLEPAANEKTNSITNFLRAIIAFFLSLFGIEL